MVNIQKATDDLINVAIFVGVSSAVVVGTIALVINGLANLAANFTTTGLASLFGGGILFLLYAIYVFRMYMKVLNTSRTGKY